MAPVVLPPGELPLPGEVVSAVDDATKVLARTLHREWCGASPDSCSYGVDDRDRAATLVASLDAAGLLAKPPKPDEPTGLGAVVATDADGDYIRVSLEFTRPWMNVQDGSFWHWDAVAAVRVLSEGVTP